MSIPPDNEHGVFGHLEQLVLLAALEQAEAVESLPEPPAGLGFVRHDWETLQANGPEYRPAVWFNGGTPLPDRYRVRFLKCVRALEGKGYLETTQLSGKLRWVRLTPEGREAAEELAAAREREEAGDES